TRTVWGLADRRPTWGLGKVISERYGSVSPDRGSPAFHCAVRSERMAIWSVTWYPPRHGVGDTTQLPARYGCDNFCHLWRGHPALLARHDAHRRVCRVARLAPVWWL